MASPYEQLAEEARRLGRHKTKEAAVRAALQEYIRDRKQMELITLLGTEENGPGRVSKKARS